MKHIKIHSFTHLLHLIYCLILSLPLFSILARCIYVQFNDNAYHSYTGYEYNEVQLTKITSFSQVNPNKRIRFTSSYFDYQGNVPIGAYAFKWFVSDVSNVVSTYSSSYDYSNFDYFALYIDSNRVMNVNLGLGSTSLVTFNLSVNALSFEFTFVNSSANFDYTSTGCFDYLTYNQNNNLDNVLEYSLDTFVNDSNIGRLNLVNWFTDVFLDSSNATNMLYLNFINWYMNYALLVSCVYILFLVLMWFVSLARRLIYKGMEI